MGVIYSILRDVGIFNFYLFLNVAYRIVQHCGGGVDFGR